MSPVAIATHRQKQPPTNETGGDSRHDRRMAEILDSATQVFCDRGYAASSMRDLSRATGTSLAGLYYYFESKEKLLYEIQKHTFETILQRAQERLKGVAEPEERIRIFIRNHLEYFLANQKGMKVLSHEAGVLGPELGQGIHSIKRQYYQLCRELLDALKVSHGLKFSSRLAVLSLFGMMNWIYTWHNAKADADAEELATFMGDLFLHGLLSAGGNSLDVSPVRRYARPETSKLSEHPTRY
ncbi:MAG: TetR/AcrR family transcriptional regulator [Terriglobales bacterium]|jgi:TetR/AcrR family transcriptional regulator, cholesterol catabolism regulator